MARLSYRLGLALALSAASVWLALRNTSLGDYSLDAAGAVEALGEGDLSTYLSAKALMGPFAALVQAPFALLGDDPVSRYQWACVPCLLAAVALGIYLGALARRRGASRLVEVAIAVLTLVNPITLVALENGHPEEILTASLAIGAIAVAAQGHSRRAGLLLGLAVVSKQWAVMAALPVLMALPRGHLRALATAAAPVAIWVLATLVAAPDSFTHVQSAAASGSSIASGWSLWYPLGPIESLQLPGGLSADVHRVPAGLESLTHPFIALLVLAVPLALAWWRGSFRLDGPRAMALLALLALLRCVLDPNNNFYYHEPLLLALIGWDAFSADRLPLRTVTAVAVAWGLDRWVSNLGDTQAFNLAYLLVMAVAATLIAAAVFRRDPATRPARAGELARSARSSTA